MSKGIVLLSGGLDSTLVFLKLIKENRNYCDVQPLFVDYGQYAKDKEKKAVREICKKYVSLHPIEIKIDLDPNNESGLKSTPIGSAWGRSLALVGVAAMWAYTNGDNYEYIALGSHKGDISPDCKPGPFDISLNTSLGIATKSKLTLRFPIQEYLTEDIGIALASQELRIPFEILYNCYWDPPCGYKSENDTYRCPGCRRKRLGMVAGGERNKELLDFPNGNLQPRTYQSPLAEKVAY